MTHVINAIVANDAGSANHIISWLNSGEIDYNQSIFFMAGPAEVIMKDSFPSFINNDLNYLANTDYSVLISGTGWSTNFEYESRRISKSKGIKTIAVIDHWANYEKRFIYDSCKLLPDEIWVTDKYAEELARNKFPECSIVIKNNTYLDCEVEEIHARTGFGMRKPCVTYVMEPIRVLWNDEDEAGEFQAFNYFYNNLDTLGINKETSVFIKPHPSDTKGKYDHLIINMNNVYVDDESSLSTLIANSSMVVGCHTYAMIIALHAGCRVICSIPKGVNAFNLPYLEIERINEMT
jgi:hypothetical protein